MMIVRLIGGLGNKLFQYAVGKQLSVKNKIPLKIDLSCYQDGQERGYKLHYFNIEDPIASQAEVDKFLNIWESKALYAKLYRAYQYSLPKYKRSYYKEGGYWVYEDVLMKISTPVFLEGFWQHQKYFENLHPQVLQAITLKEAYKPAGYSIISQIEQDDSSVAMHIRRGDYVSDPNNLSFFGVMPVSYYQRAVAHICSKVKNPTFYVFSDDLDWVKDNIKIQEPMLFVDIAGGKKDYLELDTMRKCRHNIIANSSFSWWGAYLNNNPTKIVVAPAQWAADDNYNSYLQVQFPSWIKL